MKNYMEMTVPELRAETKRRGLPQQADGKKFVKSELIERLVADDDAWESIKEVEEPEKQQERSNSKNAEEQNKDNIVFAKNYVQIVKKYHGSVTEDECNSIVHGDIVVFVHHVEAEDGNVYRKIRTAKVTNVYCYKRFVRVETLLGTKLNLPFEDILHIRKSGERLPEDIRAYMSYKRTRTGKKIVRERLGGGNAEN